MSKIFIGFDSARGTHRGAICKLVLQENGDLRLPVHQPISANWQEAIELAGQNIDEDLCIWAIDQPICVVNQAGCRPVEAALSSALMRNFGCGAFPSNLNNACWQPNAQIWDFLRKLVANKYMHNPMEIPQKEAGRYYFECYPHPALLGLFDLRHILKYKIRHHDSQAWQNLLLHLQSLSSADLPITNIDYFVTKDLVQNKANEDNLDAIICAYIAAYWWKYGTECSTMIGDLTYGYIVTPHSANTLRSLTNTFGGRINMAGMACAPPQAQGNVEAMGQPINQRPNPNANVAIDFPVEPQNGWSEPVTLCATDTVNLWRTSQREVINAWMREDRMGGYYLWIRFIEEDGQPTVLFEEFANHGQALGGMKPARQQINRQLWRYLVEGSRRNNRINFPISYRYSPIVRPANE